MNNNSVAGNHRARRSEKLSRDNVGVVDDIGTFEHCDSGETINTDLESKLEGENSYAIRPGGKESMKKEHMRPSVATTDEDGDASNMIVEIPESVHAVDVTVEPDRVDSSKKIGDSVASSSSLDKITEGINAGLYTDELMRNCKKTVTSDKNISINDLVEALKKSVAETETPGSSTSLIAYFNGQVLHVANVGNMGFMIIRNDIVLKRSSPIHHELNFPVRIERGSDPSAVVEEYKINLEEGNVIVTATGGLFDNIYGQEIASTVLRSLKATLKPQEIAEFLAARAQEVGRSKNAMSPFADAAQAAACIGYSCGKLDNVTVIVSLVQKKSSS